MAETAIDKRIKKLEQTVEGIKKSIESGVDITPDLKPVDDRVKALEANLGELEKRIKSGQITPEAAEMKVEEAEKQVEEVKKEASETEQPSGASPPADPPDEGIAPPQTADSEEEQPGEDEMPLGVSRKGIRLW